MGNAYVAAIDQSTSATKALIIDRRGEVVARRSLEHRQYYPRPGWVEHDPLEIYRNVKRVLREAVQSAGLEPWQLAMLTITNQRETAVMWDKATGRPVCNAIVWQCRRTADLCEDYKTRGWERTVRAKTGLRLDPYFSASKWRWILDHAGDAQALLKEDRLLAGTMDSWLIWKLTGGKVHATDLTNASRTCLFHLRTLDWDEELLQMFGIPRSLLPEVRASDDLFGMTNDPELSGLRIPITGVVGDSQGALFGQMCIQPGFAKATYGTGTSVMMNIGDDPASPLELDAPDNGLVTTIGWARDGKVSYALEAIIRTSGDCVRWVRDNLGLFRSFEEIERMASSLADNEGVYLVPAFVGMGAPYWDPHARAAIIGLSRGAGKAHIARAALESIAYQIRDAFELMQQASGVRLTELRADGGASENRWLMQFQSDILQADVVRSPVPELSAIGSAYMGGLGMNYWRSLEEITSRLATGDVFKPEQQRKVGDRYYGGWKQAVAKVLTQPSQ